MSPSQGPKCNFTVEYIYMTANKRKTIMCMPTHSNSIRNFEFCTTIFLGYILLKDILEQNKCH